MKSIDLIINVDYSHFISLNVQMFKRLIYIGAKGECI